MASLGAIMVLGSLMGMLACLFALPPILKLMGRFTKGEKDETCVAHYFRGLY
jgi:hypothetical protein